MIKPFLTGSRKYGPITKGSDIDIVMLEDRADKLKNVLNLIGIETESTSKFNTDYLSYYILFSGFSEINIISVGTEREYDAWKYATERLSNMHPIKDRSERIKTFKSFRQLYLEEVIK